MAPSNLEDFARRLVALREKAKMTQVDLAEAAGISVAHVSAMETARRAPSFPMLFRLAAALDCTAANLLGGK